MMDRDYDTNYRMVCERLDDAEQERDRLAVENVALREALREVTTFGRVIHGDWCQAPDGGCKLTPLIAVLTDPSPAVAEIERLVALGRAYEREQEWRGRQLQEMF